MLSEDFIEMEALDLANQALARIPNPDLTSHVYQLLTFRGQVYQDSGDLPHAIEEYARRCEMRRRFLIQAGGHQMPHAPLRSVG
jgi:hypothetical protein